MNDGPPLSLDERHGFNQVLIAEMIKDVRESLRCFSSIPEAARVLEAALTACPDHAKLATVTTSLLISAALAPTPTGGTP